MPDDIRMKRIASFFRNELNRIVTRELKNPVFDNVLISFEEIKISRDLSTARVAVSVFGDDGRREDVVRALNEAKSMIRREIMKVSELRKVPVFIFEDDRTIETAAKLEQILDSLDIPPEEEESEN